MQAAAGRPSAHWMRRAEAERVVAVAVRAPSLHNSQPWLFTLREGALELRADTSRHLPGTDPDAQQLLISCGAALFGARLGVRALGRLPHVELLPEPSQPDLLARVHVRGTAPADAEEASLLRAVPWRWTVRSGFAAEPVPAGLLTAMRRAAGWERAVLLVLDDSARRRAAAELVAVAERAQRASGAVSHELTTWTSRDAASADGVSPWAYPAHAPAPDADRFAVRDFTQASPGGGSPKAGAPEGPASPGPAGDPVAAALLTGGDGPADRLRAGQALHRVLLTAAAAGVQASLHSQPFGVEGLRRSVREVLTGGAQPQILLQFGHPAGPDAVGPATPRRPVAGVLAVDGEPPLRRRGAVGTFDLHRREARP